MLYGRHLWQQDYLPIVTVSLLWSLFAVLERSRTRVALLVTALFVLSIQLNLSAVALILPIAALLAYRAREVDWRAVVAGCAAGVVLLGPWPAHNAKHGFRDFSLIANNGRGHGGAAGTGTIEAIRQVINLVSAEGWTFVTGARHVGGAAWTLGRAAGVVVIALLGVGIVTTVARVVRAGGRPGVDGGCHRRRVRRLHALLPGLRPAERWDGRQLRRRLRRCVSARGGRARTPPARQPGLGGVPRLGPPELPGRSAAERRRHGSRPVPRSLAAPVLRADASVREARGLFPAVTG